MNQGNPAGTYRIAGCMRARRCGRLGLALATVTIFLTLKLLLDWGLGPSQPISLFLFAVMISAWYGGLAPGMLAMGLAVLASELFFLTPRFTLTIPEPQDLVRLGIFIAEGSSISVLMEALHGAKRRAELANRAKDHFLAVLSHELRAPLTPVLLRTTALLGDPRTPAAVRPALEMIGRNVELEARLIDDLLDLTRIVRGTMSYRWERADVHDLIGQSLAICRGEIDAKPLRVTLDLAATHPIVRADPARLQQVLWNLIKNALKFTPADGTIAIRTRREPDGTLEVAVSDTGRGIAPENLPVIFEAFEQGDARSTQQYGGMGLGLAISRLIVTAHGGALTAASAGPDRGATFTLRLPPAQPLAPVAALAPAVAPPADPTAPVPATAAGGLRVLLVEDDPLIADLLGEVLGATGHRVAIAHSVAAALLAADRADFDLLISDIGLPDGSGHDLIRMLRSRLGRPILAVALSGYGMDRDLSASRAAGFAAHLIKPIDVATLDATIRRVADRGAPAVPARPLAVGCAEAGFD